MFYAGVYLERERASESTEFFEESTYANGSFSRSRSFIFHALLLVHGVCARETENKSINNSPAVAVHPFSASYNNEYQNTISNCRARALQFYRATQL